MCDSGINKIIFELQSPLQNKILNLEEIFDGISLTFSPGQKINIYKRMELPTLPVVGPPLIMHMEILPKKQQQFQDTLSYPCEVFLMFIKQCWRSRIRVR